ncbi:hypothetical protein MW887_011833 [Aspergillus wentii]|nr:hypothetical protein MW887_011833 [Aspergillus wentii]
MDSGDETNYMPLVQDLNEILKPTQADSVALVNPDIRNYFIKRSYEENPEKDAWLSKPEIPSSDEILGTDLAEEVELMPNKIDGPWPSKDAYLKAHYELLREDAVAPLRDAVAYFREDPHMMDSQAVSIYDRVYVTGLTFAQQGLAFRLHFSTTRAGKNIDECIIAVVAARPLEGVKKLPREIDVFFARPEEANFDPQLEWIMVEARTGYYESLRHTMTALQKMNHESFPLADHICSLDSNIDAPEYVKESPVIDIQSAIDGPGKEGRVNILEDWPRLPTGDLDNSQWAALEQILTKKLSIAQGPPGTGKTYVSVVALRILLSNMQSGDPPIIIAAQTNHALDQLLNHISHFEKNYIRLGARSSDVEIKKRTLFAVRQKEPMVTIHGSVLGPARKTYRSLSRSITELLQAFNQENADAPLPSSFFAKHGLLTQDQCDSLEKDAKGWIRPQADENFDPLETWLGDEAVKFEVKYSPENFGFSEDEVDLEYEQLKELEAEQGIEEDDYETLKGQFIHLSDGFQGREVTSSSEDAALDYLRLSDMRKIPLRSRGSVYNALRKLAKEKLLLDFRKLLALYNTNCDDLQIGKWERDHLILQNTKVIGMTTTGLSKYRGLISSLKPKVILIEEAAEVIEAPISVACLDSLQHLILVGDHQQLRGHCSVQDLEGEPFFLDTSMFERLVHNRIKYVTLRRQRRMAPEIRQLLEPIYGDLQDHPSVQKRPQVPGMGKVRSFFFSHSWPENSDSMYSKFNEIEANMVVGFFVHLVLNGVPVKDITILTFYNGQRKRLLKMLRNHPYLQGHYVKVVTVDSYQGEENEIVILSLVRSPPNKNIGFLSIENRVCVALSRAKSGFYIFGNAKTLASADPIWWQVISIMGTAEANGKTRRLGFYLPLTCTKHGKKTFIQDPSEWSKTNGGCELGCNEKLECGHTCALRCHSCTQPCAPGHSCLCKDKCKLVMEADDEASLIHNYSNGRSDMEKLRAESIRKYHEFANGGVKEHDAILLAKARSLEEYKMSRALDSMALEDADEGEIDRAAQRSFASSSADSEDPEYLLSQFTTTKATVSKSKKPKSKGKQPQRHVPQGNLLD